jgi:endonuclease/exonuclease/phosphatase family metal-dependent hydrolase
VRRSFLSLVLAAVLVPALTSSLPAEAAKPATPGKITKVTARPGPKVGQITLSWKQDGKNTTGYRLETTLNTHSKNNGLGAPGGRRARVTNLPAGKRSVTLSAARVNSLGAGVASGNALFFRFYAVNKRGSSTTKRAYPYLQAVLPRPQAPKARGTAVRVATFNVRTSRATQDKRSWLKRAPDVAREIVAARPGVVAIQELGPGRADGKAGATKGAARQTTSLQTTLAKVGGKRYRLVRTTPYAPPGAKTATQGARILYDSSRYKLITRCPDKTGKASHSLSCTATLPKLRGDSESHRIRAGIAQFSDRRTGARFWFASAHLDNRHSGNKTTEKRYDALRMAQAHAIAARVAHFNKRRVPVVIGGDFNSWQNNRVGNSPHDHLVALGFYDTSAAVKRVRFNYTTYNAFKTRVPAASHGIGVRLDQILVKGVRGSRNYNNVMKPNNAKRPSDHNLMLADIVL